jgi:predicted O-methyltransferase YrrM
MTREEFIIKELNERNYKVGVEVGSFRGHYANYILKNWNGMLYMVDVWRELDWDAYTDTSNRNFEDLVWYDAMKSIKGFEERALMLRMYSNQASKLFADDSLDFVYIDANHKYEYVKEDIELWWPKIKSGGMISGHDYIHTEDWDNPPFAENGKDKHMYMWRNEDKGGTFQYAGLFGVYPAVNEFAKQEGYQVLHTDEWLSSWYFFKR